MTAETEAQSPQLPDLADDTIVYRLVKKSGWFHPDTGELLPIAFELQTYKKVEEIERETEMSLSYNRTIEWIMAPGNVLKKCHGLYRSEAGMIRQLDFSVVPDTEVHALILGLIHPDFDQDKATADAFDLMAIFNRAA